MDRLTRPALLGSFAITLVCTLVHVACSDTTAIDHGTSEVTSKGSGYGYGYYGAGSSVADDSSGP